MIDKLTKTCTKCQKKEPRGEPPEGGIGHRASFVSTKTKYQLPITKYQIPKPKVTSHDVTRIKNAVIKNA